jgi:hypothetical protein
MANLKSRLNALLVVFILALVGTTCWVVERHAAAQPPTSCATAPNYISRCQDVSPSVNIERDQTGRITGGTITVSTTPHCGAGGLQVGASLTTVNVLVDGVETIADTAVFSNYSFDPPIPAPLPGWAVSALDASTGHALVFNINASLANNSPGLPR